MIVGGLIVLPPTPIPANSGAILRLAAQHRLPTIYPLRSQASSRQCSGTPAKEG